MESSPHGYPSPVAPLAYLVPPVSGAIAFFLGVSPRARFHGLQSVVIGVSWPVLLYVASVLSSAATQLVFVLGVIVWLGLLISTALGRDLRLPLIGVVLARSARLS